MTFEKLQTITGRQKAFIMDEYQASHVGPMLPRKKKIGPSIISQPSGFILGLSKCEVSRAVAVRLDHSNANIG